MKSSPKVGRLEEMAKFVNTRVFELVTKKMGDDKKVAEQKDVINADRMKQCFKPITKKVIQGVLSEHLTSKIEHMYDVQHQVASAISKETTADVARKYNQILPFIPNLTPDEIKQLVKAFTKSEYIGSASYELKEYVERCWRIYCENSKELKAPYVTVVQSFGFGKSRMVFELARMALEPSSTHRVIYVCARKRGSFGYPVKSECLQSWMFSTHRSSQLITRLKVISQYAKENWETVQEEWLRLFTDPRADADVRRNLEIFEGKMSLEKKPSTPDSSSEKMVILVIDEARSLLDETDTGLNYFRLLRHALHDAFTANGGVFGLLIDANSRISDLAPQLTSQFVYVPSTRRARGNHLALFPPFVLTHTMDLFWRKHCDEQAVRGGRLRDDAKMVVNMGDKARETAGNMAGGQMSDLEEMKMEDTADNESKASDDKEVMGIDVIAYKDAVTGSEQNAWNALKRMGRPLWYTYSKASVIRDGVVMLAAKKLLLGQNPGLGGYKKENMFGVASLLCRVGLRPYSTSPLASQAVADLMGILAYVTFEKECYVSSYTSDPMLALGAIEVWYGQYDALSEFILPQLTKLVLNEALDTGGIGKVVARIVLLLAMDKCVLRNTVYTGHFIAVHSFLKAFDVEEMPVFTRQMLAAPSDTREAFRTWLSKWDGWQMGFTHFVQLKLEPTVETLWCLLGRRAAGIFPRDQKGANLLIPIFWKKEDGDAAFELEKKSDDEIDAKVSFILIQVENRSPHDSEFRKSATKLCPSFVFGKTMKKSKKFVKDPDNPLGKISVHDVICISMNVQGGDYKHHRFIFAERTKGENKRSDRRGAKLADTLSIAKQSTSKETAGELRFTLCYRSVRCDTYNFLHAKVAKRLENLAEISWDSLSLVDGDLKHRQEAEQSVAQDRYKVLMSQVLGDKELREIACKGLADPPGRQKASEIGQSEKGQDLFSRSLLLRRNQGDQRRDSRKCQRRV